ncbi:hypothetical protein [Tropicimonas sp.]|uniref:hypothetical protein n=1 Tax=Tropicimonas sp. TaxID=2067044 RepID=UPI003A894218
MMTRVLFPALAVMLALAAAPASAACYADYKAKRDDPLRLHYGTIRLRESPCTREAAASQIATRIAKDGWTLLNVLGVFDEQGLDERKKSAGQYHLRY